MGIEPYLAAAAINGIISQRLVRRICQDCIAPAKLTTYEAEQLELPANTPVYTGNGCGRCNNTGYKGRLAVYEYIIMDNKIRRRMSKFPARLAQHLRNGRNLAKNAARHVQHGNTTASEALSVLEGRE